MIIDIIAIVLICVCIFYCKKLEVKIKYLKDNKNELVKLIKEFDLAILRAESGINELNKIGLETHKQINKAVENAKYLINDLNFASDMACNINKKVEQTVQEAKKISNDNKNAEHYINDFKDSHVRNNIQSLINKISKPKAPEKEEFFSNNKNYNIFKKAL